MKEIIRLENITKIYSNGVIANNGVTISLNEGEIHAIAGENGAGKSTIMKILYGAEQPTSGNIFINGEKADISSPKVANKYGIGMVYQHFMLINEFKVYENIFFGIEKRNKFGILDRKSMIQETKELCKKYDMEINPLAVTDTLPVGMAQKVEILKVLQRGSKIIILDEPTAVLTPQETKELFKQIKLLKAANCTIVIITHKLKEIKELCDRVTIMRNGKDFGVYNVADVSEKDISNLMIGNNVQLTSIKKPAQRKEKALKVKNLTIKGKGNKNAVNKISFTAYKGEILCIAGVEGNGQREVAQAITGFIKNYDGIIEILDQDIKKLNISKIRKLGFSHIPEDRMKMGCDLSSSIYDNYISLKYNEKNFGGFIRSNKLKKEVVNSIKKYQIKGTAKQNIGMLSGGNMQKVVVARELENNPTIIFADQPTRGVDVGAIEFIHKKLIQLRDEGLCIIIISADLSEVFNLADRILVFHNGEITAEIKDVKSTSEEKLGRYMLGLERMDVKYDE